LNTNFKFKRKSKFEAKAKGRRKKKAEVLVSYCDRCANHSFEIDRKA
jgi:hypothetical protein